MPIKPKPGYVVGVCPACQGKGNIDPIGNTSEKDFEIRNLFPTLCDSCSGEGKCLIKVNTEGPSL